MSILHFSTFIIIYIYIYQKTTTYPKFLYHNYYYFSFFFYMGYNTTLGRLVKLSFKTHGYL